MIIKLILLILFGILWRMGGSSRFPKAYRRIGCPIIFGIRLCLNFTWLGLLSLPLLFLALSRGYGESSWLMSKLHNSWAVRFTCGLLYSLASVFMLWGNTYLIILNILFVSIMVMLLGNGVFKLDHVKEEFCMSLVVGLIPILT